MENLLLGHSLFFYLNRTVNILLRKQFLTQAKERKQKVKKEVESIKTFKLQQKNYE
jgi:hypothetical protein